MIYIVTKCILSLEQQNTNLIGYDVREIMMMNFIFHQKEKR